MNRLVSLVLVAVGLAACEDGPKQTYQPPPPGADTRWNDSSAPGTADPATQGFNGEVGGATKQDICPGPVKKQKWATAFTQPILPPRKAAGIDMAGSDSWTGLTVEQAEQTNCQSASLGDAFGDGNLTNAWGDNQEVVFEYRVSNRQLIYMGLSPGYTGAISFKSRDGKSSYVMQINSPITKNGTTYPISWNSADATQGPQIWASEFTDALFATFAPDLPIETNCISSGHCIVGFFGDQGYMFVPALGFAFRVTSVSAQPPTPYVPSYFDLYFEKVLPFSYANTLLKLDASGPQAVAAGLGPSKSTTCVLKMGMDYGELLQKCVQVSGNATADQAALNKLLGGLSHGDERFRFDVSGVDVNFTDKTLAPDNVIRDQDKPTPDDVGTTFNVDQSTLGVIANDYQDNDPAKVKDLHGTGLVYAEFVRLVQEALNANTLAHGGTPHSLGDAECLPTDATQQPAAGCTGFEGFLVPLAPARVSDPNLKKLAWDPTTPDGKAMTAGLRLGLKPGHQKIVLCDSWDGAQLIGCEAPGDTFVTAFNKLVAVYGRGKVGNLPPDMQDARFFFKQWATAFFKYLVVETADGKKNGQLLTTADVRSAPFEPNDVFFDSIGAGQFEIAEYVDRRFASATQDPTDISLTADVRNGIFDGYDFSRDILRGETAIYTAMRENQSDAPGVEGNALLTNIFGSPVLLNGWASYQCATAMTGNRNPDPQVVQACGGQTPPLDTDGKVLVDEKGRPILAAYPGAFSATGTVFRIGGVTPISLVKTYPDIQQAMVSVPLFTNPYDQTSAPIGAAPPQWLIPWMPKQTGVGFPVAVTGTRDRFVETYQLDFSGTTISANIDYDFAVPSDPTKGLTLEAVETTDFLGEVFLCQDPASGDLLRARMYSPVATILDWIRTHPTSTVACGLIVRFSPYNNYPDYITSLVNGVRLGITQGGGFGRVVDVTLFNPNL